MLKTPVRQILAHRLAAQFMAELIGMLGSHDFMDACCRNVGIPDGICASHDFCDANMVMAEAFKVIVEAEPNVFNEDDAALWSEAWRMATPAMAEIGRYHMMQQIQAAWTDKYATLGLLKALWSTQDGYGKAGFMPEQGYDWSGIRDSSSAAVKQMYAMVKK